MLGGDSNAHAAAIADAAAFMTVWALLLLRPPQMTAHMNAAYQAHNGLPPDIFPGAIPVYTGHYHLPHTLAGTSITYVGSPYQGVVTGRLTEAGKPGMHSMLPAEPDTQSHTVHAPGASKQTGPCTECTC
jgi:hypothetical protein